MAEFAYIRFETRDDAARGVDLLAAHTRVSGYRGGVWGVLRSQLKWLDEAGIRYRPATGEEVEHALAAVHHPPVGQMEAAF